MRSGTGVDAYQKKRSDMINPSKKLNPFCKRSNLHFITNIVPWKKVTSDSVDNTTSIKAAKKSFMFY